MTPKIIGLLGRSRVGKDTIAEMVLLLHPEYSIHRLSYPLKRAACNLYDFTMDQLESNSKEVIDTRWNKTPREVIQSLTEYMMNYMGKDFFTKKLFHQYDHQQIPCHIIIPDIRYEHDILEIQRRGGVIIKVERANNPVYHTFEQHIDFLKGNYRIQNTGTIDDLHNEVIKMMKLIKS